MDFLFPIATAFALITFVFSTIGVLLATDVKSLNFFSTGALGSIIWLMVRL